MAKLIVNILIACGSGIATSTIAAETVNEVASKAKIRIKITKCTIAEIKTLQKHADIILTTANYSKPLEKPYLCVKSFVSGMDEEAVKEKLTNILLEVQKQS